MMLEKLAFRWLRTVTLFTASLIVLTACAVDVPATTDDAPAAAEFTPAAASETAATETQISELPAESTVQTGRVESVAFGVQESTFLSHVASAIDDLGSPGTHHYVEVAAPDGITWQGERFSYSDGDVVFLQQANNDGLSALQLNVPTDADQEAMLTLLPETPAANGEPVDVDIQFVRARLNSASESAGEPSSWSFDVTVAHPDTGWEDYVDGWHVETTDGRILGTRILLHPHVGEQPFTRSINNVSVPDGVDEIRIRAHDLVSGYGPVGVSLPLSVAGKGDGYEVVR